MADPDGTCAKVPWSSGDATEDPNEQLKIQRGISACTHDVKEIYLNIYYAWTHETALHFFTLPRGPFPYITCMQTLPFTTLPYIHA